MKLLELVKNATQPPRILYGMHMIPGTAEYREPGKDPYRIFLNEATVKQMDPSFAGRPVYVLHKDEVDLANIQNEADGFVVESFYNKWDGKHWAKIILVSDKAHEAYSKGWKLSNAYLPKELGGGGLHNGVEYLHEIKKAEYEHLAIVPNPRYEESKLLTVDEFKLYNEQKEQELKRLTNSLKVQKENSKMQFNFFKRAKVENSADLEGMCVVLPKSGKEITIEKLINDYDAILNMHGYANGDHMVKVGEEEMSVNELVKKFSETSEKMKNMVEKPAEDGDKKENEEDDKDKKKENTSLKEFAEHEEKEIEAEKKKHQNALKQLDEASKIKNADERTKRFNELKNADKIAKKFENEVETSVDQVERGRQRYGK